MPTTPVAPKYGRADTVQHRVSSSIHAPVFVDNAVLYAEYQVFSNLSNGLSSSIQPPIHDDFQFVHDRKYRWTETQDGIRVFHPHKAGMRYDGQVMFNGERLDSSDDTAPILIIGTDEILNRLVAKNISADNHGTLMPLPNMKNRRLKDIDWDEPFVRLGQTVSIGFRTTDAVQRLYGETYNSINSFDIGYTFTGPRGGMNTSYEGADIARHSKRFIAMDLFGVSIIEAIQHYGRFDNHALYMDRFGNLLYAPTVFSLTNRSLGETVGIGEVKNKPLLPEANRVVSQGRPRGFNDDNVVAVEDMELQKKMGAIKTTTVFNPLAKTPMQSRRAAAETLRGIKRVQRVIESKSHINSWDLEPGDVVKYEAPSTGIVKYMALLKASHTTRDHSSDFVMMHNESGIESIIAMSESTADLSYGSEEDATFLSPTIDLSNTGVINFNITPFVSTFTIGSTQPRQRSVGEFPKPDDNAGVNRHAGFIIGHRTTTVNDTARGAIGVGASRSTKTNGGLTAGGVLTVDSTTDFPTSGTIMVVSPEATKARTLTYTGKTATTFTGCAPASAITYSTDARVIYARPRSHEMRMCRGKREVVM
tara:strand:- start:9838 stop:11610 length:1773 start_codon:yes stop_codon:yes gene_type:complete